MSTGILYGTAVAVTCSINSLASGGQQQSNVIDNTSVLAVDYKLYGSVAVTGSVSTNSVVNIWVSGSDDGTNFGGTYGTNATSTQIGGGNSTFTLPTQKSNLRGPWVVPVNAASGVSEYFEVPSVAAMFGYVLPTKFVVIVDNETGLPMATAGNALNYKTVDFTGP